MVGWLVGLMLKREERQMTLRGNFIQVQVFHLTTQVGYPCSLVLNIDVLDSHHVPLLIIRPEQLQKSVRKEGKFEYSEID